MALLQFGPDVLLKPARGGKRHNLTNTIKSRCTDNKTGHVMSNTETTSRRNRNPEATLAAAVSSKIEDGNLKAAIRLLCSEETVAPFDSDTHAQLRAKHPPSSLHPSQIEPPDGFPSLILIGEAVADAIRSFPAGSSGGPDGLKPIHLSDMLACQEVKHELIAVVTEFLNLLMDGICPLSIRRIIFGGRLIALNKKGGGIRPIAIGYYWRRLAAKCANNIIAARLRGYFSPIQVGVGVKGGCEAAIHAVRRFLQDMPDEYIVAKLDFTNAFNCICRKDILRRVAEMAPDLYKYVCLAYATESSLAFGSFEIASEEGVQQGDPLGPLLFCLCLHPIITNLQCDLRIGYMDDVTLGGHISDVSMAIEIINREGSSIGLKLNPTKCEVVGEVPMALPQSMQDFIQLSKSQSQLLGAPLLQGEAMDSILEARCDDLNRIMDRLALLGSHDALVILRAAFGSPVILHVLRSSPCFGHPSLPHFDQILRNGLERIVNCEIGDLPWSQA